jgi:hypothetical protein
MTRKTLDKIIIETVSAHFSDASAVDKINKMSNVQLLQVIDIALAQRETEAIAMQLTWMGAE